MPATRWPRRCLPTASRLFGRSFKYHRPRGVLAAGVEEPNALVTVLKGEVREPNIPATMLEIHDGLVAVSQNRFPSLAFDVGAVNQLGGSRSFGRLLLQDLHGPGVRPLKGTRFWMLCEHFIRRAAGLGSAGSAPDPARYETHERLLRRAGRRLRPGRPDGRARRRPSSGARVILAELDARARRLGQLVGARRSTARRPPTGRPRSSPNSKAATMSGFCRARRSGAITTTTRSPRSNASPTTRMPPARASRAIATGRSAPARWCSRPAPSNGRWSSPATTGRA